jgi:hypothetical protein
VLLGVFTVAVARTSYLLVKVDGLAMIASGYSAKLIN